MSKIGNERFRERALAAATSYASVLAHNNAQCIYPPNTGIQDAPLE